MTQVLKLGFRPFYLLAAFFAVIAVSAWLLVLTGRADPNNYLGNVYWHSHEMVFGFVAAVITGFLFTAVRNWTGQPTPTGAALGAIALLWLLARVAFYLGAWQFGVIVDVLFLPVVTVAIAVPIFRSAAGCNGQATAREDPTDAGRTDAGRPCRQGDLPLAVWRRPTCRR